MLKASQKFKFKNIISCTADNPLIDASYAKKILKFHKKNDLTTNLTLPIGMFSYAINIESLKKVIKKKNSKKYRNMGWLF